MDMAFNAKLSIYNILGQKVATLINKKQNKGMYQVEWGRIYFKYSVLSSPKVQPSRVRRLWELAEDIGWY